MEVWVLVGLYDGLLEVAWVFDNLEATKQAFKDYTGVDHDDYEKAYEEWKGKGKLSMLSNPLMENWDHHKDAWIVNTAIE